METIDNFRGDAFPDLDKANAAKPITDLVSSLIADDKEIYQIANDEKDKRRNQLKIDYCSFEQSQKTAIDRGNKNACADKKQFDSISTQQATARGLVESAIKLPPSGTTNPYGNGKKQANLPKQVTAGAVRGGTRANRNRPLSKTKFHQGANGLVSSNTHYVTPVKPSNQVEKAKANYEGFMLAQAGKRGTSIGDRAIVFSANGTPHYGDSYLDKSLQDNLSANQATATPAVTAIPKSIKATKPIDADKLNRAKAGQIHPKSDTMGNILALGVVAAAVTAVMFAIQYVLGLVAFIMQIQTLTSTVTNLSASFLAIFNNVIALFGLGKDVAKPMQETFDGIFNNAFGKGNVDYVKLQFAKINTTFTAGVNILQKVGTASDSLGNAIQESGNNTSRIGNALKGAGIIGDGIKWMNEQITAKSSQPGKLGDITNALNTTNQLSDSLSSIVQDVVTAKTEQERLEKEYTAQEKEKLEGESKATEKHTDPDLPEIPAISQGNL
jgi:hypothetical protein